MRASQIEYRHLWRRIAFSILALVAATTAHGQPQNDYPAKPVRMIIGFPAGGGADIVGRIFAEKLGQLWDQPVIVENRAGASGIVGTEAAARATPDGYTIFLGTLGTINTNQYLYSMDVNPLTAFVPVSGGVAVHFVLVVNPALPAKSVKELIALAKQKPGAINYSSSGPGGGPHLAGALFNDMAGIQLTHIPYKGSAPSFTDLLGNQVSLTFDSLVQALPYIKAGKLRPLAVLGTQRASLLPDVPTMAEAGLAGYDFTNWFGFVAPTGTPDAVVRKLNADIGKIQTDPATRQRLAQMGADVMVTTPEQFGEMIRADNVKWKKIIQETGIKP